MIKNYGFQKPPLRFFHFEFSENFEDRGKIKGGGALKSLIFNHFEERFFTQNPEISDLAIFATFPTFLGYGDKSRVPGPRSAVPIPLTLTEFEISGSLLRNFSALLAT